MPPKRPHKAIVRVPATTANLGPGFDCLGVALNIHNVVNVWEGSDNEPVPMSQADINYEEGEATPRPGTKPLLVTQPLGPSYTIDKGEVVWQNWHFRFRLDPR